MMLVRVERVFGCDRTAIFADAQHTFDIHSLVREHDLLAARRIGGEAIQRLAAVLGLEGEEPARVRVEAQDAQLIGRADVGRAERHPGSATFGAHRIGGFVAKYAAPVGRSHQPHARAPATVGQIAERVLVCLFDGTLRVRRDVDHLDCDAAAVARALGHHHQRMGRIVRQQMDDLAAPLDRIDIVLAWNAPERAGALAVAVERHDAPVTEQCPPKARGGRERANEPRISFPIAAAQHKLAALVADDQLAPVARDLVDDRERACAGRREPRPAPRLPMATMRSLQHRAGHRTGLPDRRDAGARAQQRARRWQRTEAAQAGQANVDGIFMALVAPACSHRGTLLNVGAYPRAPRCYRDNDPGPHRRPSCAARQPSEVRRTLGGTGQYRH